MKFGRIGKEYNWYVQFEEPNNLTKEIEEKCEGYYLPIEDKPWIKLESLFSHFTKYPEYGIRCVEKDKKEGIFKLYIEFLRHVDPWSGMDLKETCEKINERLPWANSISTKRGLGVTIRVIINFNKLKKSWDSSAK